MSNPEAIETKVTIENPDIGEEADDVMEMKAISGSGLVQPPTIKTWDESEKSDKVSRRQSLLERMRSSKSKSKVNCMNKVLPFFRVHL